jgi:hypothetical protein
VRVESSLTSVSWIPSEAISGVTKMPFELKVAHYDSAPPDRIDPARLDRLRDDDRFRFANHLAAWIEVDDIGAITRYGRSGGGVLNNTRMRVGPLGFTFQAFGFPDLKPEPEVTPTSVVFQQTAGGRPGMPAPRIVRTKRPALVAPTVWTTLRLELHADGRVDGTLAGATPFPRHWVYGPDGELVLKSATISFEDWYDRPPGATGTPWGDEDSPVFATMAESALERELTTVLMRHGAPDVRELAVGELLTRQGDAAEELYVLLDGVVSVDVDGQELGDLGPGAVVGERAILEGGNRTATLRAVTKVKVAVVSARSVSRDALVRLTTQHHREDEPPEPDS